MAEPLVITDKDDDSAIFKETLEGEEPEHPEIIATVTVYEDNSAACYLTKQDLVRIIAWAMQMLQELNDD